MLKSKVILFRCLVVLTPVLLSACSAEDKDTSTRAAEDSVVVPGSFTEPNEPQPAQVKGAEDRSPDSTAAESRQDAWDYDGVQGPRGKEGEGTSVRIDPALGKTGEKNVLDTTNNDSVQGPTGKSGRTPTPVDGLRGSTGYAVPPSKIYKNGLKGATGKGGA